MFSFPPIFQPNFVESRWWQLPLLYRWFGGVNSALEGGKMKIQVLDIAKRGKKLNFMVGQIWDIFAGI